MAHVKLTLAYDGTDFHGWQIQPGKVTVQGLLTTVLQRVTQEEIQLRGAGRTDAGVHAAGQVADFQTTSRMSPAEFQRALNALLPPAVRVLTATEVVSEFHSRWNALAKTYRYRIFVGPVLSPFLCRYVYHQPVALNFGAMSQAARLLEGEHDFTSFAASSGSEEEDRERTPQRTIYCSEMRRSEIRRSEMERCETASGEEWVYVIRGKSFLRYMVRNIAGTLMEIGRGRINAADIPQLLESRDRSQAGPTMPPQGLCLAEVEYADSIVPDSSSAGRGQVE